MTIDPERDETLERILLTVPERVLIDVVRFDRAPERVNISLVVKAREPDRVFTTDCRFDNDHDILHTVLDRLERKPESVVTVHESEITIEFVFASHPENTE